ncbi:MAG: hemolysin family protein [Geminicoccaceae bacterium]
MDFVVALELSLFVILLGFSGFFSSSETALFSLSKRELDQMRRDDNPRIELIERLLSEPRRLIVTILIGNEFVNVAASVISAAIVIRLLGADSKLINLLIMVPILLLVGEITPKTLAIRNNVAFATFQAVSIEFFAKLITPLRALIRWIADFFTTLIVGKERVEGNIVTQDMVRTLAQEAVGEGVLDRQEARYIDQIFSFGARTLRDVHTPRASILFLPAEMPTSDVLASLRETRHTKVPVYRENRDNIVGILHSRDLLGAERSEIESDPDTWLELLREPYIVPENKPASDLFRTFRERRLSMALTVDEYGGIKGLVTMEDLLECIFGSLPSPSDVNQTADIERRADGSAALSGLVSLKRFNREFGTRLKGGTFETVAGMILHRLGELPPEGKTLTVDNVDFTVTKIENNRIETIEAKVPSKARDGDRKPGGTSGGERP